MLKMSPFPLHFFISLRHPRLPNDPFWTRTGPRPGRQHPFWTIAWHAALFWMKFWAGLACFPVILDANCTELSHVLQGVPLDLMTPQNLNARFGSMCHSDSVSRERQDIQAMKMEAIYRNQAKISSVKVGDLVVVKVVPRDRSRCDPSLPIGVIFGRYTVGRNNSLSFEVVTEHGVLTVGDKNKTRLSHDKIAVFKIQPAVSPKLWLLKQLVLEGKFDAGTQPKLSVKSAHEQDINHTPLGRTTCSCTAGCTKRCGCRKRNAPCSSGCNCKKHGNCTNTELHEGTNPP